jgi:hypothetical protein
MTRPDRIGKERGMQTRRPALIMGLVLALLSFGCAQAPIVERDLNAEAMDQMSFWGGSPP